jgi:4-diphosphocytidyl-2-C-methyl-D-erythritol kinase
MIELLAPAKLTWYLEITGRREDGYHFIRSEMVTLDLADRLMVDEAADYLRLTRPTDDVPVDASNLVARALHLVGRHAGVTIDKVVPAGGGLGGGSADAAAILRWAGGVSADQALTLGADVPFCQLGGRALVEGVGEVLTPLPFEQRALTLMMPSFAVDTAACYRVFDRLRTSGGSAHGRNHLEEAAGIVQPHLARTLTWLRAELGREVQLAGSGSTMFVEGHLEAAQSSWDVEGPEGTVRFRQTTTTPS